jgi:hypothetical protein
MPQVPRSLRLLRKAEAALLSAIEVYNKPDFKYREETFAILMLNAWELLLKAKVVLDSGNKLRSIFVYETRATKSGRQSKKTYLRKNRSGNLHTKSLGQVIVALDKDPNSRLSPPIRGNLDALVEIRDNAVHYFNASPQLAKQVLEIGTASVKNFIELARRWFQIDLSGYGLYLMPIGFVAAPGTATAIPASPDEAKLVRYLAEVIQSSRSDQDRDFNVALEVNLSFKRAPSDAIAAVAVTTDPSAPKVTLSEEDIRKTYPWHYAELVRRLRARYSDFKATQKFHSIRKPLMADPRYVRTRYLDPENPKSGKKDFYNANIVSEFDKHYTRGP